MNDNQLLIAGNLVADPEPRQVAGGRPMTKFRIASTPRHFNSQAGEWTNGDTVFLTVVCWNRLAERVGRILKKGDPVTLSGRLRMSTYEVEGKVRTSYEMEAQQVSPDLNRVEVVLQRVDRGYRPDLPAVPSPGGRPFAEVAIDSGPLVPVVAESAA
jgi:single-strand DNA-binding protein